MTKAELNAYYHHLDNVIVLKDNIYTARNEGRIEGKIEGRIEGRIEGMIEGEHKAKLDVARRLKSIGLDTDSIMSATGLKKEEIEAIS